MIILYNDNLIWSHTFSIPFKEALDKYNMYLFVSCSTENYKINQYKKFQSIQPKHCHFIWFLVNSIIPRVSHRPLYCVFIKVDFKKQKLLQISIFLKKWAELECKHQHAVITYANTSFCKKNLNFFWKKKWGMMLHLSSAP